MKFATLRNWLTPGLIIAGVILVIVALVIPNRSLDLSGKKTLATVIEVNGSSFVEGVEESDSAQLQSKASIRNLDLIKTEGQSSTLVKLVDSNAEIKILENSVILFEENTEGIITLTIREGQLVIEDLGDKPDQQKVHFWIRKEGRQLSALDYVLTNDNMGALRKENVNLADSRDTLSQAKIEEILNNKKNDFFRCYGQLIQKEEQAHGQVLLSFEILNTGKVQTVDVAKSDLNQSYFLACLKEVVLRTKFPAFAGKSITTVFPLKFE